jgi:NTE family protein
MGVLKTKFYSRFHMRFIIFSSLISVLSSSAFGQPYKNLVFEGGGMRGISYAGALKELEQRGLLGELEKVGGTSVGAITALTLALGYKAHEIESIIAETNPKKFNDGTFLFFGGVSRLRKQYGWYKGNAFLKWTEVIIARKTGNPNITFQQLHEKKYPDLYVTGTSLNNQKIIVFSYETYPDMMVKDAIRISMSIPFFFRAVFIDASGHVLGKKKERVVPHDIMVDGGFIANYPIDLFDAIDSTHTRIPNPNTLGFRLDTPEQVGYDLEKKGLAPVTVQSTKNYVGAFFNFIIENLNRANLTAADWHRTVSIQAALVGPKIKKFTPAERDALIENGRQAMKTFLDQKDPKK